MAVCEIALAHIAEAVHNDTETQGDRVMSNTKEPIAQQLRDLIDRSGLPQREVSNLCGYSESSATVINRACSLTTQGDRPLSLALTKKLTRVLAGRGNPPIRAADVMALARSEPSTVEEARAEVAMQLRGEALRQLVLDTGGEVLPVRMRIEDGVFVRGPKNYGPSRIATDASYPAEAQWAAVYAVPGGAIPVGANLHIVEPSQAGRLAEGRRVVVRQDVQADIHSFVLGRIGSKGLPELDGMILTGTVAGVVIGQYTRD
jgi:hypothetical protein